MITIWKQSRAEIVDGLAEVFTFCVTILTNSDVTTLKEDDNIKSPTVNGEVDDRLSPTVSECATVVQRLLDKFHYSPPNLRSVLTPLCTQERLSVSDRLAFVRILKERCSAEKNTAASCDPNFTADDVESDDVAEFDSSFLSHLYQVQQMVEEILAANKYGAQTAVSSDDVVVVQQDLDSVNSKEQLFERILAACTTTQQLAQLSSLRDLLFADSSGDYLDEQEGGDHRNLVKMVDRCLEVEPDAHEALEFILSLRRKLKDDAMTLDDQFLAMCCLPTRWKGEVFVNLLMRLDKRDRLHQVAEVSYLITWSLVEYLKNAVSEKKSKVR